LLLAAEQGNTSEVRALLDAGIDRTSMTPSGHPVLIEATGVAAINGHVGTVVLLLDQGGKELQSAALLGAAEGGHPKLVAAMLREGADVSFSLRGGPTPLIMAAQEDHLGIVRALLDAGADVNAQTSESNEEVTALIMAAQNGCTDIVRLLVVAGADVNATAFRGHTALVLAAAKGHAEIVKALLAAGAKRE
jgi:ankyrin repeat protein